MVYNFIVIIVSLYFIMAYGCFLFEYYLRNNTFGLFLGKSLIDNYLDVIVDISRYFVIYLKTCVVRLIT